MRAVVITEYGYEGVLDVRDVEPPVPSAEEVLVRVSASALNRADMLQRMGLYPQPGRQGPVEIPGMEFAGVVEAIGPRVRDAKIGDEVMGIVTGAAQAELIVTHERLLMPVPSTVELRNAAAIPEVFVTAYDALVVQGALTVGRRALIHAGASGVGTAAIQICRAVGAEVAVTCSSAKVADCVGLGADLVIDYTSDDFADRVIDWTAGIGVDVILDVVGGDYLAANLKCVRVGGRIMQVGVMSSGSATFPLGALLPKRASIIGTVLRSRPLEERIAITQRVNAELIPLFESRRLRPVIDSRYEMDEIADAHRYMATNANVGKILIDIGS